MNYRNMPVDKVRAAIEEGKRHLNCCCYLYGRQLQRGQHFLHEHPARALSWVHPQMAAICKMHGVNLVTADQCMYGLETPSAVDGSPASAMKPTRFLNSLIYMARRLQKRCDHSRVHQQLVGGNCKDAAYDHPPLIRAMLRGMHDTTMAQGKDRQEKEELTQTLNAISDNPTKPPDIIATTSEVKSSSIKQMGWWVFEYQVRHLDASLH